MRGKNLQIFSIVACLLLVFFISNISFSQWTLVGAVSDAGPHPCISVVDESTIFIFGGPEGQPKVFRSTDGGINFTELGNTGLGNIELTCGWAVDTSLIFAGNGGSIGGYGGNASFYKSTDGGTTWTVIDTTGGTSGFFNGIVFSRTTPMFGVAESDAADGPGNPFLIWITTDGGFTWIKTTAPSVPGANFSIVNSIMVIDDEFYGFGLWSGTSQIYMTTNGGADWNARDLGIAGDFVYGLAFSEDKMRGIAGTAIALPNIARTFNGGATWETINTNTGITNSDWYGPTCKWIPYTDVCYFAGGFGSNGVIAKSIDGGITWEAMTTDGMTDIYHMEFYSATTTDAVTAYGYAVTGAATVPGRVLKLIDIIPDTLHVPSDYASIQEAIDVANNGDIVLVAEDTYYENINYKGKAITVASHFLVDGDTSHISNTIIDGSQPSDPDSGSVVYFVSGEDTTSILCGFTITGGTGTYDPYPARVGGGILCSSSGAKIIHNHIENNNVVFNTDGAVGGGVAVGPPGNTSWVIIENNIISNNSIHCAGDGGGGAGINVIGNVKLLNNIIEYNTAESIEDLIWGGGILIHSGHIITNYEWFVIGNTIRHNKAIAPAGTGNDGGAGGGLAIVGESNATIKKNIITYNEVQSNAPISCFGGGVILQNQNESTIFSENYVAHNKALENSICRGAGITIWSFEFTSGPRLYNNIIVNNTNGDFGGGIFIGGGGSLPYDNEPVLINNTISQNSATYGGAVFSDESHPLIINSILWNNGSEIYAVGGDVQVYYSDIEGGFTGEGNIDANPLFVDPVNSDFRLQDNVSPCLQVGIDSIDIGGSRYYCPPFCYYNLPRPYPVGTMPDMGACENQILVGIDGYLLLIPEHFSLSQNYPNPFNPTTTIVYGLRERTIVELIIFDVLGREVETLVNREQAAGYYEIEFSANRLASGIYFYRMQAGNFVETKKMILLR